MAGLLEAVMTDDLEPGPVSCGMASGRLGGGDEVGRISGGNR